MSAAAPVIGAGGGVAATVSGPPVLLPPPQAISNIDNAADKIVRNLMDLPQSKFESCDDALILPVEIATDCDSSARSAVHKNGDINCYDAFPNK